MVTWKLERKCINLFFREYLRQKWIDLRQITTKVTNGHSTHAVEYISPAEMFRFCDNL